MLNRQIQLPGKQSFFLFGPRQTGKSTLIESRCLDRAAWRVDLLLNDEFFKYSRDPSLFRHEADEKIARHGIRTIMIDEVQRVPLLLNEVQALMGRTSCRFILT